MIKLAESIIKWKNIPVTRKQLEKAKAEQKKADEIYEEKREEFFNSTTLFRGWTAENRFKMIMAELKIFKPRTMSSYIMEAKND